jgi:hypothetical protein
VEVAFAAAFGHGGPPRILPRLQQLGFAFFQAVESGIVAGELGQLALHSDEFGSGLVVGAALVVEPIGIHQSRHIVVGMFVDGVEKPLFAGHDGLRPRFD